MLERLTKSGWGALGICLVGLACGPGTPSSTGSDDSAQQAALADEEIQSVDATHVTTPFGIASKDCVTVVPDDADVDVQTGDVTLPDGTVIAGKPCSDAPVNVNAVEQVPEAQLVDGQGQGKGAQPDYSGPVANAQWRAPVAAIRVFRSTVQVPHVPYWSTQFLRYTSGVGSDCDDGPCASYGTLLSAHGRFVHHWRIRTFAVFAGRQVYGPTRMAYEGQIVKSYATGYNCDVSTHVCHTWGSTIATGNGANVSHLVTHGHHLPMKWSTPWKLDVTGVNYCDEMPVSDSMTITALYDLAGDAIGPLKGYPYQILVHSCGMQIDTSQTWVDVRY